MDRVSSGTAGAQLVQTIFDGGKLAGEKDLAKAKQQELVAIYQDAVLQAYADVEVSLGQVYNMQEVESRLQDEVAAAAEAFKISDLQYRQGAADLLTVLQTQQTLFSARDQLIQVRLARMQAIVQLYVALGGGWKEAFQDRTQFIGSAMNDH
jgi:multidrug efflux system outer membrane protein